MILNIKQLASSNLPYPAPQLASPALQLSTEYRVLSTEFGGADRDRTGDPLLAKQVLSQLSYSPF